jgi:hypothetical protein
VLSLEPFATSVGECALLALDPSVLALGFGSAPRLLSLSFYR